MSRAVKIILALSLIVNVALVGMTGSFIYKKKQHQQYMKSLHSKAQKFKPEVQSQMREKLRASRGEFKQVIKGTRKSHKELMEVLTADEFDEAAFDKATEAVIESQTDMTRIKMGVMGQVASELSADERKAMAHHLMSAAMKSSHMKGHKQSGEMQKRRQEFMRKRMEQGGRLMQDRMLKNTPENTVE